MLIYNWNEWQQKFQGQDRGSKIICYHKVFILPMKQYSVIWKQTWIYDKCILPTLGKSLKKFKRKYSWYAKKCEKMKSYKTFN